jgi:hypothetical protein
VDEDAVKRADESGASAIFEVDMTPGNMRYQAYPSNTKAPAFTVESDDGLAVRIYVRPRYLTGDVLHWSNMYTAQQWYAGGPSRPELTAIAGQASRRPLERT